MLTDYIMEFLTAILVGVEVTIINTTRTGNGLHILWNSWSDCHEIDLMVSLVGKYKFDVDVRAFSQRFTELITSDPKTPAIKRW